MLELREIVKTYVSGDEKVSALNGVSLAFRKNEFVSILGPSGCGKTTLLNIIGGLDQYTDGDLVINGKSTKNFTDRDFDTYRNHSIGFVFQSYNLIPHQSVLSNVELALTLSGVSAADRRRRAEDALRKVGLGDQMKKKPNQMSGGQMQRVAIARALVNDPDILLADEPTGALDSETSVQIMDILRDIAKDKLVIMVTHNPDLAAEYSTRIIRVLDGVVIDDSAPYSAEVVSEAVEESKPKNKKKEKAYDKKTSMSFLTALSLSFNNLMTKKARTFMTSFAGSIGIIGIALILSVSTGVNAYINQVQEDTLISYPLTINAESDMSSILTNFMSAQAEDAAESKEDGYVYSRDVMYDMMNSMTQRESNNLTDFKKFLDSSEEMKEYASNIKYGYGTSLSVYTKDSDGKIVACDMEEMMANIYTSMGLDQGSASSYGSTMTSMGSFNLWQEMIPGENGELISPSITEQYDVIYGDWPKNYNEAVLVVSEHNEISDYALYGLGLKPFDNMIEIMESSMRGEKVELKGDDKWSFKDIVEKEYRFVLDSDKYEKVDGDVYVDRTVDEFKMKSLFASNELSTRIKIVGIIRASEDATSASITGAVAYTSALTDYIIEKGNESELVKKQLADKEIDVITGLPFEIDLTDAEKITKIKDYIASLEGEEQRMLYLKLIATPSDEYVAGAKEQFLGNSDRATLEATLIQMITTQGSESDKPVDVESVRQYFANLSDDQFYAEVSKYVDQMVTEQYAAGVMAQFAQQPIESIKAVFDSEVKTDADYLKYYELYMPKEFSDSSYEDNLKKLGYVNLDTPTSISIYVNSFDNKDKINEVIAKYNEGVSEEDQIKYTDYFAIMMSGISTVINAISYVLIAFVAISLVVSSIMIGIITYISVLERTKEIGILRAIGASKKDIARVFNAETLTVGFVAGLIGIIVTLLLLIPINAIIHHLTGISNLTAILPVGAAVILVLISMVLTVIAGLFPSSVAAKKDPVVALRTE